MTRFTVRILAIVTVPAALVGAVVMLLLGTDQASGTSMWIGPAFVFVPIAIYAFVGLACRTANPDGYFVAGRRVPAALNGMATAADWMSAASFISLAGVLYLQGFDGLVYIVGWTGGYCLLAFLAAEYLRRSRVYTVADFLARRYDSSLVRVVSVGAILFCSFSYLTAQLFAVGIIASRLLGVDFQVGVFIGLAGVIFCSFLGGMFAITWTQAVQYLVLVIAFLVPVGMLSYEKTGSFIPYVSYAGVLDRIAASERRINADPLETEVRAIYVHRAQALEDAVRRLPASHREGLDELRRQADRLRRGDSSLIEVRAVERAMAAYPRTPAEAENRWTKEAQRYRKLAAPLVPHAEPFGSFAQARQAAAEVGLEPPQGFALSFWALLFCLMLGTAGMPHVLVRFCTTTSAAAARRSVCWALLFIALLYLAIPALASFVKDHILGTLVGIPYAKMPAWVAAWSRVDPTLIAIRDINGDGIIQAAEISVGTDLIVLAMPEIAGLSFVVVGLIAAGAMAAALSTADGLLLTIAAALTHDVYYKAVDARAEPPMLVTVSKVALLLTALLAAGVAAQKPGNIVFLVASAFSVASATIFPALVLGIFWRRATATGVLAGMLAGFGVCLWYFSMSLGGTSLAGVGPWFGVPPEAAGFFGSPVAFVVAGLVSIAFPQVSARGLGFFERLHRAE